MTSNEALTQDEAYAILICMLIQGRLLAEVLDMGNVSCFACPEDATEGLRFALRKLKNSLTVKQHKAIGEILSTIGENIK